MKITALTKFKQGDLWLLLRKLNWTQSELGRRTGLGATRIGEYINLKRRPTKAAADSIQQAFALAGQYVDVMELWPEAFSGLSRNCIEQTREVELERLEDCEREVLSLPVPEAMDTDYLDALDNLCAHSSERDRGIFEDVANGKTLARAARRAHLSRQRVYQILESAGKKIEKKVAHL